jgi:hypothetical protein
MHFRAYHGDARHNRAATAIDGCADIDFSAMNATSSTQAGREARGIKTMHPGTGLGSDGRKRYLVQTG